MRINHNIAALNTHRQLNSATNAQSKSMEKLASGLRINRAGDDAAGLAISEKMRGQVRGLEQASKNSQDGISMIQTAEGALNETHDILQRMRELSNQSANGTATDADRTAMQDELNNLTSEINRIGNTTEFNTQKILNGGIGTDGSDKITKATSAKATLGTMTTGTVAADTAATKTLGAITNGTTTAATQAKTADITYTAGNVAAGTVITVDGVDYTNSSAITLTASAGAANAALIGAGFADANGNLLSSKANVAEGGANTAITIESKTTGPAGSVAVQTEKSLTGTNAVTSVKGNGVSATVGGKTYDLSNIAINKSDATTKATSITNLKNAAAADGSKFGDAVDIEFVGDVLKFTDKATGASSSIQFESVAGGVNADSAAVGLVTADLGTANKVSGTDGSRIVVDNTTFNLGGVNIDTTSAATIATSIEALKEVTSGGTKLGDLVDIKNNGGKLEFTAKSEGKTSTISFTGTSADSVLGLATSNIGATAGVKGTDTTIERAGLEAGKALETTSDISIGANSTFKIGVGTDSDVTITLNKSNSAQTYNTSNADANVAKDEMNKLLKDVNAALQDAGLDGKVSASLSKDNKIQFISETGVNLELKDGKNNPLANNLGFTDKATDMGNNKNVQQEVGPGAQGSGYTTTFQIGANTGQSMSLSINDMRAGALNITGNAGQAGFTKSNAVTNGTSDTKAEAALNISNKEDASKSIAVIDKAIASVSSERGKLGAVQNRLEHTINNLNTSSENLTAAESRIRDVDMAKEMMEQTKNSILSQAAQAMLAQANQQPQGVLQLLR